MRHLTTGILHETPSGAISSRRARAGRLVPAGDAGCCKETGRIADDCEGRPHVVLRCADCQTRNSGAADVPLETVDLATCRFFPTSYLASLCFSLHLRRQSCTSTMHHPLPQPLETFPGFREAYDNYCLAPWSCHRAIERDLIPHMMKVYSKLGMSGDFKTGVQALIGCMKFATVAAERADHEDSIDLVGQTGRLRQGVIVRDDSSMKRSGPLISVAPTHTQLAYGSFEVAFTHSVSTAPLLHFQDFYRQPLSVRCTAAGRGHA